MVPVLRAMAVLVGVYSSSVPHSHSFRPQPARPPPPWLRHRNREKAREEEEQKEEARRAALALGEKYPPSVVDRLVTMNQEELDYDLIVAVIKHICDHMGVCAVLGVGLAVM